MSGAKVVVLTFNSPFEAEVARTRLDEEGIWCAVENAQTASLNLEFSAILGRVQLVVFEEDLERANTALISKIDLDDEVSDDPIEDEHAFPEDDSEFEDWDSELAKSKICCPKCGSYSYGFAASVHYYWAAALLLLALPLVALHGDELSWLRDLSLLSAAIMIVVGFWASILKLMPLQCLDCGESGSRKHFLGNVPPDVKEKSQRW